jgi:hypothetical protein
MATRWELVVALAREVDEDCAAGRKLDLTRVARLARSVLDFQQGLVGNTDGARPGSTPTTPAASGIGPSVSSSSGGPISGPAPSTSPPPSQDPPAPQG